MEDKKEVKNCKHGEINRFDMKKKVDIDYKTEPMAYDTLLATVRLLKEWYNIREKVVIVKSERIEWFGKGEECSCELGFDGSRIVNHDKVNGDCEFCKKRESFYLRIKELTNKQRAIKNKLRHRVKYCCERCKKLEFMIENGLGWKDMENDCT